MICVDLGYVFIEWSVVLQLYKGFGLSLTEKFLTSKCDFHVFVLFDVVICASHRSFFSFFGSILIILCFVYCAAFALVQSFSIILWFQLKSFLVIFLLWMLNLQVAILVIQRLIDGTEIRMRTMALTALKLLLQRYRNVLE